MSHIILLLASPPPPLPYKLLLVLLPSRGQRFRFCAFEEHAPHQIGILCAELGLGRVPPLLLSQPFCRPPSDRAPEKVKAGSESVTGRSIARSPSYALKPPSY